MNFRNLLQLAVGAVALTVAPCIAHAELIPISIEPAPDIANYFIQVNYDATTQLFTASGYALLFTYDDGSGSGPQQYGIQPNDDLFNFSITAQIDNTGHLIGPNAGSMTITGTVPTLGGIDTSSGTLLTGNLSQFGFDPVSDGTLEFVFQTTGGALSGQYSDERVIMSQIGAPDGSGNGFSGSFSASFASDPNGAGALADVGTTPEPGTIFLLTAAAGLLFFKMRRSQKA